MDASDVAESIITQLTRDDGEREWPILIMYPGGPCRRPSRNYELSRLHFATHRGVTSFVVSVGGVKMRSACPIVASRLFTGHILAKYGWSNQSPAPVGVAFQHCEDPEKATIVASDGCCDGDVRKSFTQLADTLAGMLLSLAEVEISIK